MIGDICRPEGPVLSNNVLFAQAILTFEHMAGGTHQPQQQGGNGHGLQGNGQLLRDPYCNGRREDIVLSGPFDCVRDIAIGPAGRRARFDPGQSPIASSSIPALVLDAALRIGAMYAVQGKSDLYVPVRIGRLVVPVGSQARLFSASPREIRTSAPRVENSYVRWDQSEVFDENGAAKLVVEDAYATRLENGGSEVPGNDRVMA